LEFRGCDLEGEIRGEAMSIALEPLVEAFGAYPV